MSDYLFLDPKVLNYSGDKYQLILLTLRWAKALKAKGSPEPMPALVEKALRDIVENKITKEEILANKIAVEAPANDIPAVISVAEEGPGRELKLPLPPDDGEEDDGKKKAKKKKKAE
jgi:DNA-directed RNA polymerase subunit K/omega